MIYSYFTALVNGGPHSSKWLAFYRHEKVLRQSLIQVLDHALNTRTTGNNSFDYIADLHRLKQLRNTLTGGSAKKAGFVFDYEQTLPLSSQYKNLTFHEALFSFKDSNGHLLTATDILNTIDNTAFKPVLGQAFRLWLIHAQIIDFYKNKPPHARLSINIYPQDTDHKDFRNGLRHGLELIHDAGYHHIILEAVENAPWTEPRYQFMHMLAKNGTIIAIDDYSAPSGHNHLSTLKQFADGETGEKIVVKVDGTIIRNFLDQNDTALIKCLRDIKIHAPQATVVAEWINSAADANNLLTRLNSYGLRHAIHLVQGRDLNDTPRDFVKKITRAPGSSDEPAPKK